MQILKFTLKTVPAHFMIIIITRLVLDFFSLAVIVFSHSLKQLLFDYRAPINTILFITTHHILPYTDQPFQFVQSARSEPFFHL